MWGQLFARSDFLLSDDMGSPPRGQHDTSDMRRTRNSQKSTCGLVDHKGELPATSCTNYDCDTPWFHCALPVDVGWNRSDTYNLALDAAEERIAIKSEGNLTCRRRQ